MDGTTTNLNDSRIQALRALVNSVSPSNDSGQNAERKVTDEQLLNLSTKLGEIFGDGQASDGTNRNEKGELVNEEGLPIVDINEPISTSDELSFQPSGPFDDPDVLPLWALSEQEKSRRKAERERILDLLEEEERTQQSRDLAAAKERWEADLERRKEAAKTEMENLKRARELQKKMGRALIRNVVESRDRDKEEKARQEQEDKDKEQTKKDLKPKKSVSFAGVGDECDDDAPKKRRLDWGDVAPGRLRTKAKSPVLSKAQMQNQPMKMEVVERTPGQQRPPQPPTNDVIVDSDDESDPESQPAECESDNSQRIHDGSDSSATDIETAEGEQVEWDEDDLDYARHQREIALAYYEKRATMGANVSSAMNAHTHDGEEHEWDQPEVPLDATLASPPPKPPISKFRAARMVDAGMALPSSTLPSHSLGDSVLPSSQTLGLKQVVRMGKLENGQLVGGDSDESDKDEGLREVIEMLKRGDITNIGPQPHHPSTDSSSSDLTISPGPSDPSGSSSRPRSKVSKFMMTLAQESPQSSPQPSPLGSIPATPVNYVERSSPKVMSPQSATPITSPSPSSHFSQSNPRQPYLSPAAPNSSMPSMIVDSPSFLPPGMTQMLESPSFQSVIIDPTTLQTPNNLPPSALPANEKGPNLGGGAVVMTSEVRESNSGNRTTESSGGEKRKKISRFMAERM